MPPRRRRRRPATRSPAPGRSKRTSRTSCSWRVSRATYRPTTTAAPARGAPTRRAAAWGTATDRSGRLRGALQVRQGGASELPMPQLPGVAQGGGRHGQQRQGGGPERAAA
eukprot:scaffold98_cov307-Prasinococcus_capsulatus_cf.AAC.1